MDKKAHTRSYHMDTPNVAFYKNKQHFETLSAQYNTPTLLSHTRVINIGEADNYNSNIPVIQSKSNGTDDTGNSGSNNHVSGSDSSSDSYNNDSPTTECGDINICGDGDGDFNTSTSISSSGDNNPIITCSSSSSCSNDVGVGNTSVDDITKECATKPPDDVVEIYPHIDKDCIKNTLKVMSIICWFGIAIVLCLCLFVIFRPSLTPIAADPIISEVDTSHTESLVLSLYQSLLANKTHEIEKLQREIAEKNILWEQYIQDTESTIATARMLATIIMPNGDVDTNNIIREGVRLSKAMDTLLERSVINKPSFEVLCAHHFIHSVRINPNTGSSTEGAYTQPTEQSKYNDLCVVYTQGYRFADNPYFYMTNINIYPEYITGIDPLAEIVDIHVVNISRVFEIWEYCPKIGMSVNDLPRGAVMKLTTRTQRLVKYMVSSGIPRDQTTTEDDNGIDTTKYHIIGTVDLLFLNTTNNHNGDSNNTQAVTHASASITMHYDDIITFSLIYSDKHLRGCDSIEANGLVRITISQRLLFSLLTIKEEQQHHRGRAWCL